ncbi:hypothetical protein ACFL1H_06320 [Nanoarchaeota archaeon]
MDNSVVQEELDQKSYRRLGRNESRSDYYMSPDVFEKLILAGDYDSIDKELTGNKVRDDLYRSLEIFNKVKAGEYVSIDKVVDKN